MKKLLLLGGLLTAFSANAEIKVDDAWVRLLPPTVKTTAAYMRLNSDQADKLQSVTTDVADRVEMHNSSMEDGVMSMEQVKDISLPPNQDVELKPHGLHLMVMGLKQALQDGQEIEFTLHFKNAGDTQVNAKVKSP